MTGNQNYVMFLFLEGSFRDHSARGLITGSARPGAYGMQVVALHFCVGFPSLGPQAASSMHMCMVFIILSSLCSEFRWGTSGSSCPQSTLCWR